MIVVFDHDLRYLSAGGLGLTEAGLSADMLVGKTIFEAFPPDIAAIIGPVYRLALAGEPSIMDVAYEGHIFQQRLAPVRDVVGAIVAGMGFALDVTAGREVELALRESEQQFRQAFDHAPIGKALIGLDGHFQRANPVLCTMTGYSSTELRALTIADITHPQDLAEDIVATEKLFTGEVATYTLDQRYLRPDGEVVWASKSASLLRSEEGSALHLIVQIQDITQRKLQEHDLSEERRRLHEAQFIGQLGSWELDVLTNESTWSDNFFELYGMERSVLAMDPNARRQCIHPDDRDKVDASIEACKGTGAPLLVHYRVIRPKDGQLRWFEGRGEAVYENGQVVRLVGSFADVTEVTEQVLADAEARATQAFQQAVISASPDIIFVYDVGSRSTVWTNRSLIEVLGYSSKALTDIGGDLIGGLMPDDDRAQFESALLAACNASDSDVTQFNHRLAHADGTPRWFSQRTAPLSRDVRGQVTRLVGALRDITDAMALEKRLEHYSLHDHLTGLPNRALLIDRLDAALARGSREGREVAVLFCDLDGFKRVNDNAGHAAGDAVLLEVGHRLQSILRDGDTVARVGGDEFVIVVEPWNRGDGPASSSGVAPRPHGDESDRPLALLVAERVVDALRAPVTVNGVDHVVSASIGITYGKHLHAGHNKTITADEVLEDADAAMYEAKRRGKDRFAVFEQGMRADLAERGRVERVLRASLLHNLTPCSGPGDPKLGLPLPHFSAAYQPIFESLSGSLVGFEALARLTDAAGIDVPPDVFIVVAEETGIIQRLGVVMLDQACGQLAHWRTLLEDMGKVTMAVNVSAIQAQESSLADDVHRALSHHGLAPSDLVLELTETALLQAAHSTINNLRSLHDEGVGIAIDDFGTGYASLRYLATLPVSAVKIDRSFTTGLTSDPTCRKIVYAVAGLAADMELSCIVEGVETAAQRAALPRGVQLQGWLVGRAAPPDTLDLRALLRPEAAV